MTYIVSGGALNSTHSLIYIMAYDYRCGTIYSIN